MRCTVGAFFPETTQYSFFTAHGPPYCQERMAIRAETGKCRILQGFEVKFPQFVPEW